ncbi:O-antigen ligase family protein, partial [Acidobacteriota bacterium]
CRTAFLFILFAVVFLFFTKKINFRYKLISILLIALLIVVFGGTLKKRIAAMATNVQKVAGSTDFITALDKVTNGRIEMMQRSIPIIKNYPLTGVGSGNFLFFLKYRFLGEQYWEDLPLNQYLLILDETGLIGLMVFVFFLVALFKQKRRKIYTLLLFSLLTAIFFNFFFWFPECLLLFWIISSFAEEKTGVSSGLLKKKGGLLSLGLMLIFISFHIIHLDSLHPKTWAEEKGREYGYGLWYLEKAVDDQAYRWTKGQSGVYIHLDKKGVSRTYKLFCGAPLDKLENQKQEVKIFWRGRLYKEITFKENGEFLFDIKGKPGDEGFLEFRVSPTFNLKKMNISQESRDLGIQFYSLF